MKFPSQKSKKKPTQKQRLAYRVDEVAELLGVSKSTVHRAIGRGQLNAVKLSNNTYIIPVQAINELLDIGMTC